MFLPIRACCWRIILQAYGKRDHRRPLSLPWSDPAEAGGKESRCSFSDFGNHHTAFGQDSDYTCTWTDGYIAHGWGRKFDKVVQRATDCFCLFKFLRNLPPLLGFSANQDR